MMLFAQDMALALTGSSTCTLIAFVFPALLFVQAAKEAQGKSDETVRVYHMHACASRSGTLQTLATIVVCLGPVDDDGIMCC